MRTTTAVRASVLLVVLLAGVAAVWLVNRSHASRPASGSTPTVGTPVGGAKPGVASATAAGTTSHSSIDDRGAPANSPELKGTWGESIPELLNGLDDPDPNVQCTKASHLPMGLPEDVARNLIERLDRTTDPHVWGILLEKIGYSRAPRSIVAPVLEGATPTLIQRAHEWGDDDATSCFLRPLRTFDATNPEELTFLDNLYRTSPEVRRFALGAMLNACHDPVVFDHVRGIFAQADEQTKRQIVGSLRDVKPGNLQAVRDFLRETGQVDPLDRVRVEALTALIDLDMRIKEEEDFKSAMERLDKTRREMEKERR